MAAKNGRKRPEMAEALRPELKEATPPGTLFILPPPEPRSGRALRPLWRDLIMKVWGEDPHKCPCCPGTMRVVGTMIRRSEVEFFLRLHGLWEGVIALPPPPDPPFDVEKRRGFGGVLDGGEAGARRGARRAGRANQTMESIEVPPHAIWRDDFEDFVPDQWAETDPAWMAPELDLGDGRRLVLDAPDPFPEEEWSVAGVN